MNRYNPRDIEPKWQAYWGKEKTFEAQEDPNKQKFYGLVEFPYPSGAGLHVGHPRSYTAMDVICRKRRMEGQNVLYPIGFDAFGLPTENFAIKTGRAPADVTAENVATFTRQLKELGFSFDWSRAVNTTDPDYYRWTQWIFLQFFKHGLAYKKRQPINWCPKDKIGLANEEVVDGCCERCGGQVEKREKEQWMLAITKYADKLLEGLKEVDYIPQARVQQEHWIGRSEGVLINFQTKIPNTITIFTTRPDTIFGATFIAISPELAKKWLDAGWDALAKVKKYIDEALKERMIGGREEKEKTGIDAGFVAVNPVNDEEIPVWVTNYVLGDVGTGAIMAVPAHDERDREFALKYNLPIADRPLVSSDEVIAKVKGQKKVNYKLRDWVFSRQRYWGEPIPLVWCDACIEWVPLSESELPLKLPEVEKYQPTDTGESPLAAMTDWVKTICPRCGGPARRETDTMPNWAGSSWYFLRYCDPKNDTVFATKKALEYWMPIDWYNGGMEHTVLHLLYSRFWNQFLYDIGVAPTSEPYTKRTSHGLILGPDGEKMSKSRGNVVNPDDMVKEHGADTLRAYILFMGPFDQPVAWDTNGLVGVRRFLERVWNLQEKVASKREAGSGEQELMTSIHQTIKKVTEDIEAMRFNTAIAKLMELTNEFVKAGQQVSRSSYQQLLKLLSPFAPHLCEELWEMTGGKGSIAYAEWPMYDAALIQETMATIAVQINGKLRGTFEVAADTDEEIVKAQALASDKAQKWLEGKEPKRVIYVKGKLVSIVI